MNDIEKIIVQMVEYKEIHQLTWKELASLLNCGESTVRFWAAGKRVPSGKHLVTLNKLLNN